MEHNFAPAGMKIDQAQQATAVLQDRLSDLIDLSLTLKHIHWNVNGAGFIAIHKLMDEQTEKVRDLVDEVAERITTLGGVAAGLVGQVQDYRTADQDYPLGRAPVMAHLGALEMVYERVISGHRHAISELEGSDPVSEDLLIGQTAALDLNHWFIRAHLGDTAGHLLTEGTDDALDAAVASGRESDGFEAVEVDDSERESASVG